MTWGKGTTRPHTQVIARPKVSRSSECILVGHTSAPGLLPKLKQACGALAKAPLNEERDTPAFICSQNADTQPHWHCQPGRLPLPRKGEVTGTQATRPNKCLQSSGETNNVDTSHRLALTQKIYGTTLGGCMGQPLPVSVLVLETRRGRRRP